MRIYAIWGRGWGPVIIVAPLSLAEPALRIMQALYVRITHEEALNINICQETPTSWVLVMQTPIEFFIVTFIPDLVVQLVATGTTIFSNCILVLLTWYKTFHIRKDLLKSAPDRPPIACFLFRDGTIYFVLAISNTAIQLAYTLHTSDSAVQDQRLAALVTGFWLSFSPPFTVILLSRFMLGLRGLYFSDDNSALPSSRHASSSPPSPTRTRTSRLSRLIGNLGATVDVCSDGEGRQEGGTPEYEDEVPEFVEHPFIAGMRLPG
ncbi:hypothetical protein C8Q74DRAFT_1363957 [Fomes fomentarius]|nr:hypothetical protein C8Q74DRAFT_1363957 [Fomes fomentarius]